MHAVNLCSFNTPFFSLSLGFLYNGLHNNIDLYEFKNSFTLLTSLSYSLNIFIYLQQQKKFYCGEHKKEMLVYVNNMLSSQLVYKHLCAQLDTPDP